MPIFRERTVGVDFERLRFKTKTKKKQKEKGKKRAKRRKENIESKGTYLNIDIRRILPCNMKNNIRGISRFDRVTRTKLRKL